MQTPQARQDRHRGVGDRLRRLGHRRLAVGRRGRRRVGRRAPPRHRSRPQLHRHRSRLRRGPQRAPRRRGGARALGAVYVATKVPPKNRDLARPRRGAASTTSSRRDHVRECAEKSLRNLGMDAIDLLQLHVWNDDWADRGDWRTRSRSCAPPARSASSASRSTTISRRTALRLIAAGVVDTVQVIYNVFDQSPEDELFPAVPRARRRRDRAGAARRGRPDRRPCARRASSPMTTTAPTTSAATARARCTTRHGDRLRPRHRTEDDLRRDRAALRPERARRLDGDPGHALAAERRAQRGRVRRARDFPAEQREQLRAHRWVRNFYSKSAL